MNVFKIVEHSFLFEVWRHQRIEDMSRTRRSSQATEKTGTEVSKEVGSVYFPFLLVPVGI